MAGKRIVIANQKGGVGKTFLSMTLGGLYSEIGHKTLLIDMDQQGSLSAIFLKSIYNLDLTIFELLTSEINTKDAIYRTQFDNLDILPSNPQFNKIDEMLAGDFDSQYLLKEKIEEIENKYDIIIIDCPPKLGVVTRMAMVATKHVVVPMECQDLPIRGLKQIMTYITKTKKRANPEIELLGLVINRFKNRKIEMDYKKELINSLNGLVFKNEIRDYVQYVESISKKKPINYYLPNSTQCKTFRKLAKEIYEKIV